MGNGRTEKIYNLITVHVYTSMENRATIMFYRTYNIAIMLGHFLNQNPPFSWTFLASPDALEVIVVSD